MSKPVKGTEGWDGALGGRVGGLLWVVRALTDFK